MKASVCLITYNHEAYIAQAIESVLMQETDFDYELIIGEDDSSDNTRNIVKEYKRRYPHRITLLLNDRKNVIYIAGRPTGRWNLVNTLQHATGEYIALLEGDDYWISPHKLQKQVDFLDSQPECAICFHNAEAWCEASNRKLRNMRPPGYRQFSKLEDLLRDNFIPACSAMFRRGLFGDFPDWFYEMPMGDWPLHILNAQYGQIGYVDEVMAVYRVHADGLWSGQHEIQRLMSTLALYDEVFTLVGLPASAQAVESEVYGRVHWKAGLCLADADEQKAAQNHFETAVMRYSLVDLEPDFAVQHLLYGPEGLRSPESIGQLLDLLPASGSGIASFKRRVWGQVYGVRCFEGYQTSDGAMVRRNWPKALRYNPGWLSNHGLLRIILWAYWSRLGKPVPGEQ